MACERDNDEFFQMNWILILQYYCFKNYYKKNKQILTESSPAVSSRYIKVHFVTDGHTADVRTAC